MILTNSDSVVVRDTIFADSDTISADNDYWSQYWLAGVEESAGYFIVAMLGYESGGSLVVSRRTGWRKFFDFAQPVFDSSGEYAAALIPVGAAFWEPTIDLLRVTPDSLISELHLQSGPERDPFIRRDTLWGPTNPRWAGNQLLFDTEETLVRNRLHQWPGKSMALVRENGRWQIRARNDA